MAKSATVLVTGATGFLGSHLVRALVANAYRVVVLKRSSSDSSRIVDLLPRVAVYDVDRVSLEEPFKEHGCVDAVIHTATIYGRDAERPSEFVTSNILFPLRVLEVAASFGTAAFLNADTFFNRAGSRCGYLSGYALSKRQFLEWAGSCTGVSRFVNVRLEHMYGPGDDDSKFITQVIKSCLTNVPELKLTSGEQRRDFVHVGDVASAFLVLLRSALAREPMQSTYEVGSSRAASIRECVELVHRLSGSRTALRFGALAYRENEIMHSVADVRPLRALGWGPPMGLEEGMRDTIAWHGRHLARVT